METGLAPALLAAAALAARSALLGGAAFLLVVSSPLARRLPVAQANLLMARTRLFLRLAALSAIGLGIVQLLQGQFAELGVVLVALAILVLAPREGPAPRLAATLLLLAMLAMVLGVSGGRLGQLTLTSLTTATLLREAGAAFWMGNLPLLWLLLRGRGSFWPAAVPQAVGMRHAGLMLLGMGLSATGLLLATPHRALLFGAEAFPLLAITVAFVALALLAAGLRVALLLAAGRATPAILWLPRLRCVVECELLLALVLCGPIVALFTLAAQGLVPAEAPGMGALLPRWGLHAPGPPEASGFVLLLVALISWLNRGGTARFAPLLLLPLGLGLALAGAPALAALAVLAGLAEAWALWRGGPTMALPFAVILGVIVVLAGNPPLAAIWACLFATIALLVRWAAVRLPDERGVAGLAWPVALGMLGLVLVLAYD